MDGLQDPRPTFYEMMLLESYNSLISNGIRHCLRTLISRYDRLIALRYHSDTISDAVVSLLDLLNFWKGRGNVEESFSGLYREFGYHWSLGFVGYILVRFGSRAVSQ